MHKLFTTCLFIIFLIQLTQCFSKSSKEKKDEVDWEEVNKTPKSDGKPVANQLNGEVLFKRNCASCHDARKIILGPALMGSIKRWAEAGLRWKIYDYVRSSGKFNINGNAYLVKLKEENKNMPSMQDFDLTDEEIDAILDFCSFYTPAQAARYY